MIKFLQAGALICVIWGVVSAIAMGSFLTNRGHELNIFLYRLYFFKYMRQYKEITTEEDGKPGFWFSSFIVSMWIAVFCIVIGLIIHYS